MQPNLKFSRGEFADRLAKTRKAMEVRGVDLLVVSDPSNMAWLTGYDGWSFYVHQAVIVPPSLPYVGRRSCGPVPFPPLPS